MWISYWIGFLILFCLFLFKLKFALNNILGISRNIIDQRTKLKVLFFFFSEQDLENRGQSDNQWFFQIKDGCHCSWTGGGEGHSCGFPWSMTRACTAALRQPQNSRCTPVMKHSTSPSITVCLCVSELVLMGVKLHLYVKRCESDCYCYSRSQKCVILLTTYDWVSLSQKQLLCIMMHKYHSP